MSVRKMILTIAVFSLALLGIPACNPMKLIPMPKPESKVILEKNFMVPMKDGVKLAGYLYHPSEKGPWPVVVNRLPYGHKSVDPVVKYFAGAGYAVFVQDTRGRYNSEGGSDVFYPFTTEESDGRDTLEWIEKQAWCNGKIATWGGSYHGFTQWSLAASNPNLDAMVPLITSTDVYRWNYIGGAFRLELILGWGCKNMSRKSNDLVRTPMKAFLKLPLIDADSAAKRDWPYFNDALNHPTRDDFWKPLDFTDKINQVNAPALFVSGWYDIFNIDQLRDFERWNKRGPDAPSAKLIVGPWNHVFYNTSLKNVDWSWKGAQEQILVPSRQWFDRWLKGARNGIEERAPVKIYVMGTGGWREYDSWPPRDAREFTMYLRGDASANSSSGKGLLSDAAPSQEEFTDKFDYDPRDPVPSKGGPSLNPFNAGPADQAEIERRKDVLVYSTEPLEKTVTVIGAISLRLFAATSAVDTDFTAKLVDVYPDGKAIIVTEGILRGRYREGGGAKLLTPDEVYEWNIDLGYTALRFNPGHRIRLEISSSNFPRFDRNLNTGESQATGTKTIVAHQKVYHSEKYPSRLVLSVVEK